jgi:hypothetical protein
LRTFKTVFESVKCDFKEIANIVFFIQYVFNLNAWKMTIRTAHQRLKLKVQKPVKATEI